MVKKFRGCMVAMATSLKSNGEINEEGQRHLVNYFIEKGAHGLFPSGTVGEGCTLSVEERKNVIKWVVDEANGRAPVYAGTGAISTQGSVELTSYAKDVGADGAILLTPFYIKPDREELYSRLELRSTITEAEKERRREEIRLDIARISSLRRDSPDLLDFFDLVVDNGRDSVLYETISRIGKGVARWLSWIEVEK